MRVVFANGVFDCLHLGHVRFLRAARTYGDRLIVGINSDESARRLKGPARPIFNQTDRHEMLMELRAVDRVIIFHEDTPCELLRSLKPEIVVKGEEYRREKPCPELPVIEQYGGDVVFLKRIGGCSTSNLLEAMKR